MIDRAVRSGGDHIVLRDRASLGDALGYAPVALESTLASIAREHDIPFIAWAGNDRCALDTPGVYEELRDRLPA